MAGPWEQYQQPAAAASGPWEQYQQPAVAPSEIPAPRKSYALADVPGAALENAPKKRDGIFKWGCGYFCPPHTNAYKYF